MSSSAPQRPQMPARPSPPRPKGGCLSITLAFGLLAIVTTLMLMLPMGNIGVAVLMFVGFFAVIATLHYLVWGRLLTRLVEQDQAKVADQAEQDN